MKVMLVEDNAGDIALTEVAFSESGLCGDLIVAHDGQEAVERLYEYGKSDDAELPDLMLVDLNMPRMGGKQLLEVVKADDMLKTIPVIIVTSSQAPSEIQECYKRHANSYILKPWGLEEYIELLQKLENYWKKLALLPKGVH